jgi:hypothetical protein
VKRATEHEIRILVDSLTRLRARCDRLEQILTREGEYLSDVNVKSLTDMVSHLNDQAHVAVVTTLAAATKGATDA